VNKKRIKWIVFVVLLVLGPTFKFDLQNLPPQLQLQTVVTPLGDVEIFWDPTALTELGGTAFKISYSYEDKGKSITYANQPVDPNLGMAAFRNLSLSETYNFHFHLLALSGQVWNQSISITTPEPQPISPSDTGVKQQLAYVDANWKTQANPTYLYIAANDCANFASQSLAARGLPQTAFWHQTDQVVTHTWVSATALESYLLTQPGFHEVPNQNRSEVKLGDLVFFDWNNSGDRDHVGIVSYVQRQPDGSTRIYYAGHTSHTHYRSVDWAITVVHPGASVYFLSVPPTAPKYFWQQIWVQN
jgi:hypothetical protein